MIAKFLFWDLKSAVAKRALRVGELASADNVVEQDFITTGITKTIEDGEKYVAPNQLLKHLSKVKSILRG